MFLSTSSWKQVEDYVEKRTIALVPIGACENHGAHLGLGTDALLPEGIAKRVEARTGVLVTPVLPFGVSDHHMDYPGTITLGNDVFYQVIKKLVFGLTEAGIRKIIFLNGHGGNTPALNRAALELSREGGMAAVLDWWSMCGLLDPRWAGGHGDGEETAAMMEIAPEGVHMDLFLPQNIHDLTEELPANDRGVLLSDGIPVGIARPVIKTSDPGWYGPLSPLDATPEWGKEMIDAFVDFTVTFLERFERAPLE